MKCILQLGLLFTLAASGSAEALQFESIKLEDLYRSAATVAVVRVTSAKISSFSRGGNEIHCGVIHHAEVRNAIKGEERHLEFQSNQSLKVGSGYILFLDTDDLASWVEFMSMGRNDEDLYNKCLDIGPGLYASW